MYKSVKSYRFWLCRVPSYITCLIFGLLLTYPSDIARIGMFITFFVSGFFEYVDGCITGSITQQESPTDWRDG